MATFFDNKYCGRPCLLILLWILGITAFAFLLLGMMIDELTFVSLETGTTITAEYALTCSSSTFDIDPGPQNLKYSEDGHAQSLLQKQAGDVWLAFGILACLFIPTLLFGIFTDYYSGIFDHKKITDYWNGFCIKTYGFTKLSALCILILEIIQIISYSAADRCSDKEFWVDYANALETDISDYSPIGGASFVMVILSLICLVLFFGFMLYYQYMISAELPTGDQKKNPVQIKLPQKKPKEHTPPRKEPTGEAPKAAYFQPKNQYTKEHVSNEGGSTDLKTNEKRPQIPPPLPPAKK